MEEELLPEYDNLSFSGFSILPEDDKGRNTLPMQSPRNSLSSVDYNNNDDIQEEDEEYFEFSTTTDPTMMSSGGYGSPDMVFCGKIDIREEDHLNRQYEKRDNDYLMNNIVNTAEEKAVAAQAVLAGKNVTSHSRSDSTIKRNSSYCNNNNNNHNYGVHQKVNITSLTSMSSKSRRRMFMFGPVKFHPEMELSALKERQSRGRVPTTMFPAPLPAPADSDKVVVVSTGAATGGDGGNNKPTRGKIRSNWGLLVRSLKGRSPITTAFVKSLGCIMMPTPAGAVGMENKWIN